ncbi:MAG: hypothetical protein IPK78_11615 [Rhodospirillales bacterium]|nr:hypothetical protein [Rhodospirillales bacterium]
MHAVSAKHFVDSEFGHVHRALVPGALKSAYDAVEALYKEEPLFDVMTAKIGKGHVIAWAVDRQIERLLIAGRLPFDYRWVSFERPTGKFLQIRLPSSTMSINQLPQPTDIPRDANFRTNRVLNNNPLLPLNAEIIDERRVAGLPHLILAHGYQELSFAQIGVLHPSARKFGWIYRTPNFLAAIRAIEPETPPAEEAADVEAVVTLKDEIARWLRDNSDDGRNNG